MRTFLLIAPPTFALADFINSALVDRGDRVILLTDPPKPVFLFKLFARSCNKVARKFNTFLYYSLIDDITDKIDCVLVIKGESLHHSVLKHIRKRWPGVQLVLYLWDSVANVGSFRANSQEYDRVYSFDPNDCIRYSLHYLPLFTRLEAITKAPDPSAYNYSFCFIGTLHSNRALVIWTLISNVAYNSSYSIPFVYIYLPTPLHFFISLIKYPVSTFKLIPYLQRKSLSSSQINIIRQKSEWILDLPDPSQSGVSLGAIDALSHGKKIISTNPSLHNTLSPIFHDSIHLITSKNISMPPSGKDLLRIDLGLCLIDEWLKRLLPNI